MRVESWSKRSLYVVADIPWRLAIASMVKGMPQHKFLRGIRRLHSQAYFSALARAVDIHGLSDPFVNVKIGSSHSASFAFATHTLWPHSKAQRDRPSAVSLKWTKPLKCDINIPLPWIDSRTTHHHVHIEREQYDAGAGARHDGTLRSRTVYRSISHLCHHWCPHLSPLALAVVLASLTQT